MRSRQRGRRPHPGNGRCSRLARQRDCGTVADAGGIAFPRRKLQESYPRHDGAPRKRDPPLREIRLGSVGKDRELLWHAARRKSAMPLYSRVRRRHSGIHRHGRTYKEQQKHPSSSRFWTGCPCVALLQLRLMLAGASSMVNVPAVQTPAVDRSTTISKAAPKRI